MATITFTANNFRRPTGRIASWFSVALIACLSSCVALYLVSLIDPNLLVPVSVDNIIGAIPLAIFCYLIGIVLVSRRSRIPNRVFLFTVIFLLRIVTGFTLAFLFQYDDERAFHEAGTEQMYGLFSWAAGTGYYHLVNMMYAFFRPNLLLPKTLNALWGSLLPFFVYDLGKRFFGEDKAAWRAFLLAAFLPPLVLFSAVNLKEISTAFLLVLIL